MNKVRIVIRANEGYGADQIHSRYTIGDLKAELANYDDDAEIVTYDLSNEYGAKFGCVVELEENEDCE